MPNALIVDDSKTARYALRQLLDKQQIASDMVESAEQALDYLRERRPDFIFMDHMMPGMDGFEAVKLIKSNRATHDIPIVMYTSSHGGVYFGQARALGAADVIAKPATAKDVQDVLQRLEQRRTAAVTEAASATLETRPLELGQSESRHSEATHPEPRPLESRIPAAQSTQAETDVFEEPPVASDKMPLDEAPPRPEPGSAAPVARAKFASGARWAVAACALAALLFAGLYAAGAAERDRLAAQRDAAFDAVQWAVSRAEEYPYGEAPFGGERLVRLQELLVHLETMGFAGAVRLESHVGEFCLVGSGDGDAAEWTPASGDFPVTECGALGQQSAASYRLSSDTSPAMRRFLERSPLLARGDIVVELVPRGATAPAVAYPSSPNVSAAVWNAAAQRNNRVTFELVRADQPSRRGL